MGHLHRLAPLLLQPHPRGGAISAISRDLWGSGVRGVSGHSVSSKAGLRHWRQARVVLRPKVPAEPRQGAHDTTGRAVATCGRPDPELSATPPAGEDTEACVGQRLTQLPPCGSPPRAPPA